MDIRRRILDRNTKHKAIALDRDFIMSLPTDEACYSLNLREVTTLLSILDYQRWVSRWYSASEVSLSEIERFTDKITQKLLSPQSCGEGVTIVSNCPHYIGDIFWNISVTVPPGCLRMGGGVFLQADYPALTPLLPASWKNDAAGTFTLPNMYGRTIVGEGFTYYVPGGSPRSIGAGDRDGEDRHILTEAEMPEHDHDFKMSSGATAGSLPIQYSTPRQTVAGTYKTEVNGSSQPHNNMPFFLASYCYIQALDCAETGTSGYELRMNGCLLEYTEDGETWLTVPGWTDLGTCFDNPPFDLRLNNCVLEYSKDSAQTWDEVPGWDTLAACLPDAWTPDDHSIRVDDGILQYTEDGGETWLNVFGWNTLQDDFLREADRCRNAFGSQYGLRKMLRRYVELLEFSSTTLAEFTQDVLDNWEIDFPGNDVPSQLEAFITYCWNTTDHHQFWFDFQLATPATNELAQYIYSALPRGEWCDTLAVTQYLACETMPDWVHATLLFLEASYYIDVEGSIEWIAELYRMMDYGACNECQTLDVIEPCPETWQKTVSGGEVVSDDGWALTYGTDTSNGALSAYGAGNTARVGISQSRTFEAVDMFVSFNLEYVNINNPTWTLQCVLNGSIPVTLASGNTTPTNIQASIPDGTITGLQLSFYGTNDYPGTILITSAYLEGVGECPFTACD